MRSLEEATEPVTTEPMVLTDVFVTGMFPIEEGDGLIRATFYVDRRAGGLIERIIVDRLVMTRETFMQNCRVALETPCIAGVRRAH